MKTFLNWLGIFVSICLVGFVAITITKIIVNSPSQPDYVVTRYNCSQKLVDHMNKYDLTVEDVARQLGYSIKKVDYVMRRIVMPNDEMIAKVEALIIVGAPLPPDKHVGIPTIWNWTKLHWPFLGTDGIIIIR